MAAAPSKSTKKIYNDASALLAKGVEFAAGCTEGIGRVADRVNSTVKSLKPSGNTALGPALALSIGLASVRPGSKIILCTDGMANNGVGAIRTVEVPFYGDMGRRAGEEGTIISVVTMEGEDCSMENLGTSADLTGGLVEMVDLEALGESVGAMLADPTLALGLNVTIIATPGITFDAESQGTYHGRACVSNRKIGNTTIKTDFTLALRASADLLVADAPAAMQVQLQYMRPKNGGEVLQVLTIRPRVTSQRDEAEADINSMCVGLSAIHRSACLAQQGEYRSARVELISTCRLLQRSMHTTTHQEMYIAFIKQAEKLDGFMRERESQDAVFGSSASTNRGRDDDASRSMYQMKGLSAAEYMA